MKKINYPLILSDFDSTITNSKGEISNKNKKAILDYVQAGGIFCVITGRMLKAIMPRVEEIGLKGLVCAYQGSKVADIETGRIVRHNTFTYSECEEIIKTLEGLGEGINYYADEVLYTDRDKDDKLLKIYCEITRVEPVCLGYSLLKFLKEKGLLAEKICVLCMPDKRDALFKKLSSLLGDRYDVTYSATVLVEISPKGDDKGAALRFVAAYYNIPLEKTVAVGDNNNDLPMIMAAGVGVCVGDGDKYLKEKAKIIAPGCNYSPIEWVIERYGFEKN